MSCHGGLVHFRETAFCAARRDDIGKKQCFQASKNFAEGRVFFFDIFRPFGNIQIV